MTFKIRQSDLLDSESLGRLHSEVWHESYADFIPEDILSTVASVSHRTAVRHEMFATSSPLCAHLLVEDDKKKMVGFCDCGPALSVGEFASGEIYTLYLLKEARHLGLGKDMFRRMVTHLVNQGFQSAALRVFADNEKTLDFYRYHLGREVHRVEINMGGMMFPLIVFAWSDLAALLPMRGAA